MAIKRALTLATVGLLAASPLTWATDGYIQTGAVPPIVEAPYPSGGAFVDRDLKKAVKRLISDHIQLVFNLDDTVTGFHVSKRRHESLTFIDVTVIGDSVAYKTTLGTAVVNPTLLLKDETLSSLEVITSKVPLGNVYFADNSYIEATLSSFKLQGDTLNIWQAFQPSDTVTFVPAPVIKVLNAEIKDLQLFIVQLNDEVQRGTVVPEQHFATDGYGVGVHYEHVGLDVNTQRHSERALVNKVQLILRVNDEISVTREGNDDELIALLIAGIIAGEDL